MRSKQNQKKSRLRAVFQTVAALLAIALLLFAGWRLTRGLGRLLSGVDLNAGDSDPMFAEEAEPLPTRPPGLDAEEIQPDHPTLDDYVPEVETPVDVTADELIRRAREAADT